MSDDDNDFLETVNLDAHRWRGVEQLAEALGEFEPLAKRGRLGETVAEDLVMDGLAEKGQTSERYTSPDMAVGYRLSPLGWKVKERGRYARRGR